MTAEASVLDQFPIEVIRTIAVHADGPTMLALSATNHALRRACYDALVIQKHVESRGPRQQQGQLAWPWTVSRDASTAAEWARWAVADFEARRTRADMMGRMDLVNRKFAQVKGKQGELLEANYPDSDVEAVTRGLWTAVERALRAPSVSTMRWLPALFAVRRKYSSHRSMSGRPKDPLKRS